MVASRIELEERFRVPVDRGRLWQLMTDPYDVVTLIPGAELTGEDDEGGLLGSMVVKLGPTTVRFRGTVVPSFDHDQQVGSLRAWGADAKGRTRATATTTFRLGDVEGENSTEVELDAEIEASGALATFVSTGGIHLARRLLEDFADNVTARARELAADASAPAVAPAGDDGAHGEASTPPGADSGAADAEHAVSPSATPRPSAPRTATPISGSRLLLRTLGGMVQAWFGSITNWWNRRRGRTPR